MKKLLIIVPILLTGAFAVTNYSKMSNEQLKNMRGKVAVLERGAFRAEMQKRVQTGTMQKGKGMGRGMGKGQGMGKGMGKGQGMNKSGNKLY